MPLAKNYDKKTPREHVLTRPDTYIGDIESTIENMYVYNEETEKISSKKTNYVPGLYKIFDEILVNARDASQNDDSCNTIKIEFNSEENYIIVQNNGDKGIPIEVHPKFSTMVPQMIFGEMLTSSNYDDNEKRTTGGRNGYGSKLTNIFSNKFEIEIVNNNKKYKQTWEKNMEICKKPKITDCKSNGYVKVKFYPDLEKFGIDKLDEDHCNLFYKRALDISGTSKKLNVYFDKKKLDIADFKKYISLYGSDDFYYDNSNERWNIGCYYQTNEIIAEGGDTISFVNGISTYKGGTHCQHVTDQLLKPILAEIKKKHKDLKITLNTLKENFIFFIDCIIENPAFSSQTKDTLTTKTNKFGSSYKPPESFIKKISKSGIIQQVVELAKLKESSQLKKNDGKKQVKLRGIPKLEDANKAGSKVSNKCSLILTEGDSAKAFAMAGLSIIGKDFNGVFPLKGKLLNVREASVKQKMHNEEINNLKQILGLKQSMTYESDEEFNTLRYGRIICLTDQDVDGSHIKGLLINFFHCVWPDLVKRKGFITSLATPIVKAFKGKTEKIFYNLTEYEDWQESNDTKGYKIKYYKGLGTSTSDEAKVYFNKFENNLIKYFWENLEDNFIDSNNSITLAFDKSRSNDRKDWLKSYNKNEILSQENKEISFGKFIHLDLKHFSNDDTARSIPNIMDGLKPSHRKIFFGALLRGLDKTEVKVAQLAGFVSDKAAYHHGEASLNGAIIGMAQDYVGSNNIAILKPNGQFGTRLKGGKDAASPRYIWTEINNLISIIFNKTDEPILKNQIEDGMGIEPEYYAPIIPMILVNGTEGIGTGFSTKIPNYNPIDIIKNLLRLLEGQKYKHMNPYWNKFNGTVKKIDRSNYEIYGNFEIKNNKVIITELPVGEWTQNYKEFLEKQLDIESNKKTRSFINYKDNNTDKKVHFELEFSKGAKLTNESFKKNYHMIKKINLNNMHLYSIDGNIKKYNSIKDIMTEYFDHRLELYDKRLKYLLAELKKQLDLISYKVKFILMVINNELIVNNRKKSDIEKDLVQNDFPKLGQNSDFGYLLNMPIYTLTLEKINELKKQMENKESEYNSLLEETATSLWKKELTILLEKINSN
uniref:DNA topoisomerase 2 n=1 Tax=Megaviridae environmental sample TaxID=1737588 RepID=A0A5J6VLD2_9VIRU|nr:MAG: DNA gyrase/topoisomerase IV, subunit A [Megaviridae environmental sample]